MPIMLRLRDAYRPFSVFCVMIGATVAFGSLLAAGEAQAAGSNCLTQVEAAVRMQVMRDDLAYSYPNGEVPAWSSALDREQAQAGFRAMLGQDYSEAAHGAVNQLHLLPLPAGGHLILFGVGDRVCGFEDHLQAPPDRARAAITAAEAVRAPQYERKLARFPGSPELEALHQIGMDANGSYGPYPSLVCEALEFDHELGVIPELEELEVNSTWRGEPVTYLAGSKATDFLSHIVGPGKVDRFSFWMTGMFLRERGNRMEAILLVRENACGFDGSASFPAAQVRAWLAAPPDNQPSFQPGDTIVMTPDEREAFQAIMGIFGGTPMTADELREKMYPN